MKTIGFIFGTRPEVIKCVPVILEAKKQGLETKVIFTGQHREMALPLLEFFGIEIDIDLNIMRKGQSLTQMTARLLGALDDYSEEVLACDIVMVQGDTTSAFVGGYFCYLNKVPVGHIEAGLRTNNIYSPFPEEGNRQLLSRISNYHFTPTRSAHDDLLNEGLKQNTIFYVGNTVIDTLLAVKARIDHRVKDAVFEKYGIDHKEYILITGHRRENFGLGFQNICFALKNLSQKYPHLNFIYPVHLNPEVKAVVEVELINFDNIKLIDPLDYVSFISVMDGARIIMTDSGGIQEEAPSFKKPLIVMRESTERPEGVELGIAKLCGTDPEKIEAAFDYFYKNGFKDDIVNPYGNGDASLNIINTITNKNRGINENFDDFSFMYAIRPGDRFSQRNELN